MGHKFDPKNAARLDDPERLRWQSPAVVLGLLQLDGHETVVDYGAGTGAYAIPLARALPRGHVVAVDMSDELLGMLREKLDDELRARIETVCTGENRVTLPDGGADAVLTVNLWHEIHDERPALAEITRLLADDGRLVIVDWAPMERPVGPPNDHVIAAGEARAEVEALGLRAAAIHEPGELFPYHYAIVAHRPDSPA